MTWQPEGKQKLCLEQKECAKCLSSHVCNWVQIQKAVLYRWVQLNRKKKVQCYMDSYCGARGYHVSAVELDAPQGCHSLTDTNSAKVTCCHLFLFFLYQFLLVFSEKYLVYAENSLLHLPSYGPFIWLPGFQLPGKVKHRRCVLACMHVCMWIPRVCVCTKCKGAETANILCTASYQEPVPRHKLG